MPERVYHEVCQAGNTKSTSLSASRKDFISTWPACLWTSASSLLEALCTILPLPSTLHLCSLIFRRLYQKYSGEKKRDTFFQQHQLLPTRDHVHQKPSPGMLALFKKSLEDIFSSSTLPVALFSRQLSQVRLHNWFSNPLQSATWTELELAAFKAKNIFDPVSFHFSIYLQHQVAALVNKCTVYNAQFFQHHIKYMVLAPGWSMRCLLIGSSD